MQNLPATAAQVANPLAWITGHTWAYPALEVAHIVGIATLFGSLLLVELRLWGLGRDLPLAPLARLGLSLSVAGFSLAAVSGLVMFASQAAELIGNRSFVLKMGLLTLAGCNAVVFHARGSLRRADALARAQTLVSLGLWLAIIICGRWIAYA